MEPFHTVASLPFWWLCPGCIPLCLTISHRQLSSIYTEFPLCGGCVGGHILVLMKMRVNSSQAWCVQVLCEPSSHNSALHLSRDLKLPLLFKV